MMITTFTRAPSSLRAPIYLIQYLSLKAQNDYALNDFKYFIAINSKLNVTTEKAGIRDEVKKEYACLVCYANIRFSVKAFFLV